MKMVYVLLLCVAACAVTDDAMSTAEQAACPQDPIAGESGVCTTNPPPPPTALVRRTNHEADVIQGQVGQQPISRGAPICAGDEFHTTCGISVEFSQARIDIRCHEQPNDPGIWCESRVCDAQGCTPWTTNLTAIVVW